LMDPGRVGRGGRRRVAQICLGNLALARGCAEGGGGGWLRANQATGELGTRTRIGMFRVPGGGMEAAAGVEQAGVIVGVIVHGRCSDKVSNHRVA